MFYLHAKIGICFLKTLVTASKSLKKKADRQKNAKSGKIIAENLRQENKKVYICTEFIIVMISKLNGINK